MSTTISMIAAVSQNMVIGTIHGMPWNLPHDLKRFRRLTLGKPIIMGRTTFQHIGRVLDKRTNIIMTRDAQYTAPGCLIAYSLPQAIEMAGAVEEIQIIGGGQVYQAGSALVQRLYLTVVHGHFPGNAFFPDQFPGHWSIAHQEFISQDERNPHPCTFMILEKDANSKGNFSVAGLLATVRE